MSIKTLRKNDKKKILIKFYNKFKKTISLNMKILVVFELFLK